MKIIHDDGEKPRRPSDKGLQGLLMSKDDITTTPRRLSEKSPLSPVSPSPLSLKEPLSPLKPPNLRESVSDHPLLKDPNIEAWQRPFIEIRNAYLAKRALDLDMPRRLSVSNIMNSFIDYPKEGGSNFRKKAPSKTKTASIICSIS
jgi:hypothetical protein